jgi:low temperature requirement protein LtrA
MTSGEDLKEQRVTWAELFVDLVWVLAVTQIAATLADADGIGTGAMTMLLFLPLWWGWVGVTLVDNAAGAALDTARGRLVLFALAGCGLSMAIAIPDAYTSRGLLFACAYCALRLLLWTVRHGQLGLRGIRLEPFAVNLFVTGPLFVFGALAPAGVRVAAWTIAVAVETLAPAVLTRRRRDPGGFETTHLPERFGLFLIIAIGETVVAVGANATTIPLGAGTAVILGLCFVIMTLLWWTYFHYGAPAARHSLRTDPVQARIARDVFSYAHLIYVIAIICIAVGMKKALLHPLDTPHTFTELLLAPGAGLFLAGFCYARQRMFGAIGLTRFLGAAACAVIAAVAPLLPQVVAAALVAAVLVTVNGVEAWRVESGRPLLLLTLPWRRSVASAMKGHGRD